jgi:hypothetical protein
MNIKSWSGLAAIAFLTMSWLVAGQVRAETVLNDGYTLEDFSLDNAADLVDICTLDKKHPDHVAAMAFCYGFFEGGIHYDDAISTTPSYHKIVCDPEGTTRTQAVEVFVSYVRANPQYGSHAPIDTIFRALVDKWPCE